MRVLQNTHPFCSSGDGSNAVGNGQSHVSGPSICKVPSEILLSVSAGPRAPSFLAGQSCVGLKLSKGTSLFQEH